MDARQSAAAIANADLTVSDCYTTIMCVYLLVTNYFVFHRSHGTLVTPHLTRIP